MSRSYHGTHSQWTEERRWNYSDREEQRRRVKEVAREIREKRKVKKQRRAERKHVHLELPSADPATIPIVVQDEGEFIHYPADLEDIREILCRLPRGTLDGLHSITLALGEWEQEAEWYHELDPWTMRVGSESFPQIYTGRTLGQYDKSSNRIYIYSYNYETPFPHPESWYLYLKLTMLTTLVHEVAHHWDFMERTGRGRWKMEVGDKAEKFANFQAYQWMRDIVVPYLETHYPEWVAAFLRWMKETGGIVLPLEMIGSNWQERPSGEVWDLWFGSAQAAVVYLYEDEQERELTGLDLQVQFARNLHYGEYYDEALEILDLVLSEDEVHLGGLTLKADIFEHQGRFDEAELLLDQVMKLDSEHWDAWQIMFYVYVKTEQWKKILSLTEHILAIRSLHSKKPRLIKEVLEYRFYALFHSGEIKEMERVVGVVGKNTAKDGSGPKVKLLKCIANMYRGYWELVEYEVALLLLRHRWYWRDEVILKLISGYCQYRRIGKTLSSPTEQEWRMFFVHPLRRWIVDEVAGEMRWKVPEWLRFSCR